MQDLAVCAFCSSCLFRQYFVRLVYLYAGYPYSFYPAQHVQLPPTFDLARFTKRDIVPNDAGAFDTSPRHKDELHISTKYITAKLTDCNLGFD
jgi:hypothetical protein